MKTPEEVRRLARSNFDSLFKFNYAVSTNPVAWNIWKTAFDKGYNAGISDCKDEETRNDLHG